MKVGHNVEEVLIKIPILSSLYYLLLQLTTGSHFLTLALMLEKKKSVQTVNMALFVIHLVARGVLAKCIDLDFLMKQFQHSLRQLSVHIDFIS